jgi:hypothetical protein
MRFRARERQSAAITGPGRHGAPRESGGMGDRCHGLRSDRRYERGSERVYP